MLANILPEDILLATNNISLKNINEIRLRVGKPIMVNIRGKNFYLSNYGASSDYSNALICDKSQIDKVLSVASNESLYTINDQLINGFVTVKGGIRIGVAGDVVTNNNEIKTIKNIKSLNIRIPHFVKNCSLNLFNILCDSNKVKNTLIISPPGAGKTTFLRDFAYQISKHINNLNILVVDERNEISGTTDIDEGIVLGDSVDVYTNCTKSYAFSNGIRSMKPDVIITDEINLHQDLNAIQSAITSGVCVVASIHAKDINDLNLKSEFNDIIKNKMFQRCVVLSEKSGPGTVEGVYNENLVCIYC